MIPKAEIGIRVFLKSNYREAEGFWLRSDGKEYINRYKVANPKSTPFIDLGPEGVNYLLSVDLSNVFLRARIVQFAKFPNFRRNLVKFTHPLVSFYLTKDRCCLCRLLVEVSDYEGLILLPVVSQAVWKWVRLTLNTYELDVNLFFRLLIMEGKLYESMHEPSYSLREIFQQTLDKMEKRCLAFASAYVDSILYYAQSQRRRKESFNY